MTQYRYPPTPSKSRRATRAVASDHASSWRLVAVSAAALLALVIAVYAGNARAEQRGSAVLQLAQAQSLVGTRWTYIDSDGDRRTFRFHSNGRMSCTNNGKPNYCDDDDSWTQNGNQIVLSYTNGYSIYRGVMSGGVIRGRARNQKGRTWTFTMRRVGGSAASLTGTRWTYIDSDGDRRTYRFNAGGRMDCTNNGKPNYCDADDNWRQSGRSVILCYSNCFSTYRGRMNAAGTEIRGRATNKRGRSWTFTMRKVGAPASVPGLTGSRWSYIDSDNDRRIFNFHSGGRMDCTNNGKPNYCDADDNWRQSGRSVILCYSNCFSTYRGRMNAAGTEIRGRATNKRGRSWTFTMRRISGGAGAPPGGGAGDPPPGGGAGDPPPGGDPQGGSEGSPAQ